MRSTTPRIIKFAQEARQNLHDGIRQLNDVVKCTIGPSGRTVAFKTAWGEPRNTKDGITGASQVYLKDPFANLGCMMAREASSKSNDLAGDGTSVTILLTEFLTRQGITATAGGMSPIHVKNGIEKGAKVVLDYIEKSSRQIRTFEQIKQIAKISANGSEEIATDIAEAKKKVGRNGVVFIELGRSSENQLTISDGMSFQEGYISPHFMTNMQTRTAVLNKPYILILDEHLSQLQDALPLLEQVVKSQQPLLVLAHDVSWEALNSLVNTHMTGDFHSCCVKLPFFGADRLEFARDIAYLTGGQVVSEDLVSIDDTELSHLGSAARVEVTKDSCTIVNGGGDPKEILSRVEEIKEQLSDTTNTIEQELLQQRIAKLIGGIAILKVGASTETEAKEKKDRCVDALCAVNSAMEEGIVPGGGKTWLNAKSSLARLKGENLAEDTGIDIVRQAMDVQITQIVENAGENAAEILAELRGKSKNTGYDARELEFCDLLKSGITDPAKVLRTALQNAVSITGLVLTTESLIIEEETDKTEYDLSDLKRTMDQNEEEFGE